MIFPFLNKKKKLNEKKELLKIMILTLNIQEEQKKLYLDAFSVLDEKNIDKFYNDISKFIEDFEIKQVEEIRNNSFSFINWIRKKEAEEKKKDLNSFNFLLSNL